MRPTPPDLSVVAVVLAWACVEVHLPGRPPADPADDRGLGDEMVDVPVPDTGPAPLPDTDPPAPPAPPADWGGGLVELAAPVWAARPLAVLPGDPDAGVPPQGTVAFAADLDEDDVPEVVVATVTVGQVLDAWEPRVLRWTAGGLVDDPVLGAALARHRDPVGFEAPFAAFDLDGDGHVELLSGNVDQGVRWGTGPGAFGPWTPLATTGRPRGRALGLADLDGDGWLDLLLGGSGCTETAWTALRTGPRTFDVRTDVLDGGVAVPWAFLVATLEDGDPLLYVVEEGGCAAQDLRSRWLRRTSAPDAPVPRYTSHDPTPGGAWWQQLPAYAGRTTDHLTPMGAGVEDLDGDGLLDVVVTTGLPQQAILRGHGDGTFADAFAPYVRPSAFGFPEFPWSVAFPDLDLDGRPEIVWTIGDDGGSWMALQGHPLRGAVSWNAGDGGFVDVEQEVGLTATGSWWALGLADPDRDGDADLVVGGEAVPPAVYRNDLDVGRRGLSLRLVGTTSNALAIGARVEAHVDGLPPRTSAVGFQGARLGTSAPLVFVGAGDAPEVDLVRIRWPTGRVQEVRGLAVGTLHTIVEPAVIEVLDADRHAPADGTATVVVRVTPRTIDGAVDAAARAEVVVTGAAPSEVRRAHDGPGPVDVTLTAPAAAGTSVVTVLLDGVPVDVRPRIRWDTP